MNSDLFAISFVALVAAIVLVVRQQNFRRRQMEHRERLAAIEKGLVPSSQGDAEMQQTNALDSHDQRLTWFHLTTLGLGFLLLFGGIGLLTALIIVDDAELRKLWTLGLVPIMTGFGLIAFWLLSRVLLK